MTTVLFVCVHNAGRSQMAAGWLRHLAGDRVEVLSAGSAPAGSINPVAVERAGIPVGQVVDDRVVGLFGHGAPGVTDTHRDGPSVVRGRGPLQGRSWWGR